LERVAGHPDRRQTRDESASSAIECDQRLGEMLRFYHRAAA